MTRRNEEGAPRDRAHVGLTERFCTSRRLAFVLTGSAICVVSSFACAPSALAEALLLVALLCAVPVAVAVVVLLPHSAREGLVTSLRQGPVVMTAKDSGDAVRRVREMLLHWKHSAIVLDDRGQHRAFTSRHRQALGQDVFNVALSDLGGVTARVNPLDLVGFRSDSEVADLRRLASILLSNDVGGVHHVGMYNWLCGDEGLLAAAVAHAVYAVRSPKSDRCSVGLAEVLASLSDPSIPLERLLEEWSTYRHDDGEEAPWRDSEGHPAWTHPLVSAVARAQRSLTAHARAANLSRVLVALEVFHDPRIASATAVSDFAWTDVMDADAPATIYLRLSPHDVRLGPILRLYLDLLLCRLTSPSGGDEHQVGGHKHELLLLLPDLAVLGRVPRLAEAHAYLRGYGIRTLVVTDRKDELQEHYGDVLTSTSVISLDDASHTSGDVQRRSAQYNAPTATVSTSSEKR